MERIRTLESSTINDEVSRRPHANNEINECRSGRYSRLLQVAPVEGKEIEMSNQVKIVLLGATSMSFGLSFLRDIFSSSELRGCTLTLVGRQPDTLAKVFELSRI